MTLEAERDEGGTIRGVKGIWHDIGDRLRPSAT